ncbi:MAG: GTP cyclohydrolase I [Bacteroidales bacterium]|nr:GTP cyclohydrolase I [Bacteroidales bacterium]
MINLEKLEQAGRLIIEGIGENPDREGLIDTPRRFAKMMEEQCRYTSISNKEIAEKNNKCFYCDNDNMVIVKNIEVFSRCEHHLALMYNMRISVGYIPCDKVIGLSKIARIADSVCRRLQIQERIGKDIFEILSDILETSDIIILIEAEHSCMTARGISKPGTITKTITAGGVFSAPALKKKEEFLAAIRGN